MGRKQLYGIGLTLFILATASCVIKSSHVVSDVTEPTGRRVEVKAGGLGVLSLSVPKLTEKVQEKIREACPGEMVNVISALTRRDFFIVQYYVLKVTGNCQQ